MTIRDKLNKMLIRFFAETLPETARQELIDCIIDIVQKEPVDPKYWNINKGGIQQEHPLAQFDAVVDDDGNVIRRETGEIPHPD